jgi:hypothetical protein
MRVDLSDPNDHWGIADDRGRLALVVAPASAVALFALLQLLSRRGVHVSQIFKAVLILLGAIAAFYWFVP